MSEKPTYEELQEQIRLLKQDLAAARHEQEEPLLSSPGNLTAPRNFENELDSQNQLMKTLLDNLQVGVFMGEAPSGKPLLVNRRAMELIGRGIMPGADKTNIADVYQAYKIDTGDTYPTDELPFVRGLYGESHSVDDMMVIHPNGEKIYLEVFGSPVTNRAGDVVASLISFMDISQRKQMENELRHAHKMESIGTLAGGIAHDFNNILSIILGNTELAFNHVPEQSPAYRHIQEIKTASLRAKNIIRQLLGFSRKTEQDKKPMEIIPIITETLNLIRASTPSNIEIKKTLPLSAPCILADATQIHQVLINLCTNAVDSMEKKGGCLSVTLTEKTIDLASPFRYREMTPGPYIEMMVSDTGIGMTSAVKEKIFDPYFTTKDIGKGTGMGLSVVRGIIENHDGYIFTDSTKGEGTQFKIFLPLINDTPKTPDTAYFEQSTQGTERLLFVDDEESIIETTGELLSQLGYQVTTDTSPASALALFSRNPDRFDLVISDMNMLHMDGKSFTGKIKEIRPDIPVIICTGYSSGIDEETAREIGVSYLMKPISASDIASLIRDIFNAPPI